ncbi:hypothetical protein [Aquitalea aquatica]|uniref:Uncharacterized protein n=1 Tax=Aquitalea aquatica TaxID=3044273 RepID=A0A838Y7A4_9NEIS|nr:hypothetical protein [Aquitalea magnusonii]MBA4708459.1 hypothetical protein [Aquitalea magnusonii]
MTGNRPDNGCGIGRQLAYIQLFLVINSYLPAIASDKTLQRLAVFNNSSYSVVY